MPWAMSFCPFRACCLLEFLPFTLRTANFNSIQLVIFNSIQLVIFNSIQLVIVGSERVELTC